MENLLYEAVEKAKLYDELIKFPEGQLSCDFCGKSQSDVKLLITSKRSQICD